MSAENKVEKSVPLVTLGFQENDFDKEEVTSDFFPNKVGGKPAWLDLGKLPLSTDFTCDSCDEQMSFLMQFYAPWSGYTRTYHRVLYVFCCQKARCNRYRVFRSQLPQDNAYYELDQEERRFDQDFAVSKSKLQARQPQCTFCGCAAPHRCGGCQKVNYCSRKHQSKDWELGHREQCKSNNLSLSKRKAEFYYKEFLIVCEDVDQPPILITNNNNSNNTVEDNDDEDEIEDDYENEEDKEDISNSNCTDLALTEGSDSQMPINHDAMDAYQDYLAETGKDNEFSEKTFTNLKDRQLAIFKSTISNDRDQILRYCRDANYQVLWVSESNIPSESDIPHCPTCMSERTIEMQILPQTLFFLDIDCNQVSSIHDIDFGILSIYTCKNSCEINGKSSLQEEFIWKQDFTK